VGVTDGGWVGGSSGDVEGGEEQKSGVGREGVEGDAKRSEEKRRKEKERKAGENKICERKLTCDGGRGYDVTGEELEETPDGEEDAVWMGLVFPF
jgi:hypothetical protein